MVRVISVHHFAKQDVSSCSAPPKSACLATNSAKLVLALGGQTLEVRDLGGGKGGGISTSHAFQTVDQVHTVLYSPVGDYLACLEGVPGERGAGIRVYTNWADPGMEGASIWPRIAGSVSPSLAQGCPKNSLDMIEFPQRDPPLRISVCQTTGNLMVAAPNLLVVYRYVTKTLDQLGPRRASNKTYADFHECIHVFHNFVPTEIVLCEDVIGCLAPNEVHIFKVKFSDADVQQQQDHRSLSLYSLASSSSSSSDPADLSPAPGTNPFKNASLHRHRQQQQQLDSGDLTSASAAPRRSLEGYDGNVLRHASHVFIDEIPFVSVPPEVAEANREYASTVNAPRIMEQTLGPERVSAGRATTVKFIGGGGGGNGNGNVEAECISLVSCKLLRSEELHDSFKNLRLQPVFWRQYKLQRSKERDRIVQPRQQLLPHPLQSGSHEHLMSLTACFTSQNEGYIYHLPGQMRKTGKGCGVQRVATYPFTSAVGPIVLEQTLLHALTETGLETYTLLRSGYHAVAEAESLNGRTNACPGGGNGNGASEECPVCLVGLRPFIGAKHLLVSSTHLVILANGEKSTNDDNNRQEWI